MAVDLTSVQPTLVSKTVKIEHSIRCIVVNVELMIKQLKSYEQLQNKYAIYCQDLFNVR